MARVPKVSVIILNYNGKKWLEKCLPTWRKVKFASKEIIVVNNGSTDDSGAFLKKNFPEVKVVELQPNRGFAGGNNIGVKKAKGKYVLILNNDTTATPDFLSPIIELMEKDNSIGVVQPQLRNMSYPDLLDSVASFYTDTGFLYHYGYMQSVKKSLYNKELLCYSIKGACMLMRKDEYLQLGGFDEDFVCYVEETDLCHRVWLSGKKVVYYPKSYIYHYGGGDMSIMEKGETTVFRAFRNRFVSYIKNLGFIALIKVLPIHFLLCEGFIIMTFLRGKFKNAVAAQLGTLWWLFHLRSVLKKRHNVQSKIRKVTDKQIMPLITHNPPLSYYVHFFTNPDGKYNEQPL